MTTRIVETDEERREREETEELERLGLPVPGDLPPVKEPEPAPKPPVEREPEESEAKAPPVVFKLPGGPEPSKPIVKRRTINVGTETDEPGEIEDTKEIRKLAKDDPKLFTTLIEGGIPAFNKAVDVQKFEFQQETKRFRELNTQLPADEGEKEGQFISKTELSRLKRESPDIHKVFVTQGLEAGNKAIAKQNKSADFSAALLNRPFDTGQQIKENPQFNAKNIQNAIILEKNRRLTAGMPLTTGKATAIGLTTEDLRDMQQTQALVFALTWGAVPILGTLLYFKEMTPVQRALSIGFDFLAFAPIGRAFGLLRGLSKLPGEQAAINAVRSLRQGTRSNLKAITNKQVVKAYDDVVKAGDKYGKNLAEIEAAEKAFSKQLGGPRPEDVTTLKIVKGETAGLKRAVVDTGNKFSQSLRETVVIKKFKTVGGDVSGFADDFGSTYANDISNIVDRSFRPERSIKALKKQVNSLISKIDDAQKFGDTEKLARLSAQVPALNAEIKLSFAAKAQRLQSARLNTAERIRQIDTLLNKKISPLERRRLTSELKTKRRILPKLEKELNVAMRDLSLEVAPRISKGGGNILIRPPKVKPVAGAKVGGGVRAAKEVPILTPAIAGFRVQFAGTELTERPSEKPGITRPGVKPTEDPTRVPSPQTPVKPSVRPSDEPEIKPAPKEAPKEAPTEAPKEAPKKAPSQAPAKEPAPAPVPEPKPSPRPEPKVPPGKPPTEKVPPPVFKPPPKLFPPPPGSRQDKIKRSEIQRAPSAFAFPLGRLKEGQVWHGAKQPYSSDDDVFTLVGKPPAGATIVEGPGSAKKGAQLIMGARLEKETSIDVSIFDAILTPKGRKAINLRFVPDPKQETTSDLTISRRRPRISGGTRARITPKRPRIGR